MEQNIYKEPKADLSIGEEAEGKSVKAIILAVLFDIVGTLIWGLLLGIGFAVVLVSGGASETEVTAAIAAAGPFSAIKILGSVGGLMISFFAARLCARISKQKYKRDVTIFGVIMLTFSIVMGFSSYSVMENIVLAILTIGTIAAGAYSWAKNHI